MRPQLYYSASQEAVPPPLNNFLSPEFAPALTVMEQFEADLLRMDEEHLQHRERAVPEVPSPSPFPDDGLSSDSTLFGRVRTLYRRFSSFSQRSGSRASDASL
ncbi:hypothetical protein J4E85_007165 [Alternaria conjuncta]|uniref:uncharacterized protein n=1 Tax=Alternaria conjuncta TaxID=181017 RepID=UPI0022205CD0|nr:uncharacterized protein J4E85_007165 [Alternaria conjuncta]KAI4925287.1 hypothetical protein J4E85_007165 [Alternaria conjuncta]